ncbi:MAG: ABC transporter ATP-binding protein [Alphaproteobacteria bacterium]|nr:ABC transporter ATP-binding protein [Alphaproteobacteria bacterium]
MSEVLVLSAISRHYATGREAIEVLRAVDLTLHAGELVALIGPSGSGKSTLLHIAGLLDSPHDGSICIVGTHARAASDAVRTRLRNHHIGFIYQFHNLLPELSALENVMIPLLIARVKPAAAKTRALTLLTRLGLAERVNHLPSQLSGGEQQRVAIARALANRPQLILADEPTGNLDPVTADSVTDLLLEVAREEGVAALVATHNMALARRLTRAVTLRDGKVEAVAP